MLRKEEEEKVVCLQTKTRKEKEKDAQERGREEGEIGGTEEQSNGQGPGRGPPHIPTSNFLNTSKTIASLQGRRPGN